MTEGRAEMPELPALSGRSESNQQLVGRFFERANAGDLDGIGDLLAPDFVEHAVIPDLPPGKAGVKAWLGTLQAAFCTARFDVDDVVGDGDTVCVRSRLTGWHRARFMGIPPTGSTVEVAFVDTFRVADGRLAEHWCLMDMWALMQQITGAGKPARHPRSNR